ncbi:MAG: tRNA uracil 4-sulfurtransferase ThiI [Anaerolineales bacterium]|jgi:thiamine biosynthesis protein ThiI
MEKLYVVHYAEIGLKGKNRPDFEKQLIRNIEAKQAVKKAKRLPGRILMEAEGPFDLRRVFGVAWWAEVIQVEAAVEVIADAAVRIARERKGDSSSFAIRATTAYKPFVLNSQELEVEVGQRVKDALGLEVNLSRPDLTVYVEVMKSAALIYTQKHPGPGGLPVGSAGKLMGLFSGGIDSAVATYLMAKRGAAIELVHFYASASASEAHEGKIGKLAGLLTQFMPKLTVHYVPFHRFQVAAAGLRSRLRRHELVAFRRLMAMMAERLAKLRGAKGLFMGDNLGQVASQTLENLAALDQAVSMPVYRPLIGYDKLEIIDLAKKIGLYELASQRYKDCCSLISRHPATRSKLEMVASIEESIGVETMLDVLMAEVESHDYGSPELEDAPDEAAVESGG